MIDLLHQVALRVDVIHLLQLDDLMLLHELHRVHVPVALVLPVLDAPEGADSERPNLIFEIILSHLVIIRCRRASARGGRSVV